MNMKYIAVFDIGKTNKKILIYNDSLKVVDSATTQVNEIVSGSLIHDDVESIQNWFLEELGKFAQKYDIGSVSISAHGATAVCVDENGEISVPELSYTTEPGEEFHTKFHEEFGDPVALQQSTATPNFGVLLNLAKLLQFSKEQYPEQFAKTKHILAYPQYYGYLLCGNAAADTTYVGSHTYLWDYQENRWSDVAEKMGITGMLPAKLQKPWDIMGTVTSEMAEKTGLSTSTVVTLGIHDSNAALLPYLIKQEGDFMLNSTGTWCVVMHQEEKVSFKEDELGKVVFYNISAFGKPVKTSIFLGGLEFETYDKVLRKIHGDIPFPNFDTSLYQQIIAEKDCFILPTVVQGSGQFPQSQARVIEGGKEFLLEEIEKDGKTPEFFSDPAKAYAVLNLSLAMQSKVAIDRAGIKTGMPIFTEGGFRKNDPYNKILTTIYPSSDVYLTNLNEASAFGAALLGKIAMDQVEPSSLGDLVEIEFSKVGSAKLEGLDAYFDQFIKLANN
ncbi:FGGY family carbohydrate kinase [Flammeovirgaceae bacterium SG7u.111]|nr:FGGY family carbohydrate kinase [Flammeovirgaceae bacterium SG7u.132]WPO34346.1 FGGY family carbohydrate kinase [Flammeovirgaceae bacterium SG7u.111]